MVADLAVGRDGTWQWDATGPGSGRGGVANCVHDVAEGGCTKGDGGCGLVAGR